MGRGKFRGKFKGQQVKLRKNVKLLPPKYHNMYIKISCIFIQYILIYLKLNLISETPENFKIYRFRYYASSISSQREKRNFQIDKIFSKGALSS